MKLGARSEAVKMSVYHDDVGAHKIEILMSLYLDSPTWL